jgi:hypothetical protein
MSQDNRSGRRCHETPGQSPERRRRPNNLIWLDLSGWATLDEVVAHLEKLKAKSREPPARGGRHVMSGR